MQDLNTLIPAGSGYQIRNATAINDNGQIVANTTSNHALLLTPSCPPAQSAGKRTGHTGMVDLRADSDSSNW